MIAMPQLKPTLTFIIPIRDAHDFIIEQISAVFKFSESYGGFCEILLLSDEVEDAKLKLARLAIKLGQAGHPHVRARMIRYTSQMGLASLIETGINHALGQKIVITNITPEMIEAEEINDIMNRDILVAPNILDTEALIESLENDCQVIQG